MKIAFLSDIHGNAVALKSVLFQLKGLKINTVYVLGDSLGYYFRAAEVFDLLNDFDVTYLAGNHEEMLLSALNDPQKLRFITDRYGPGIECALAQLTPHRLEMVRQMPRSMVLELDNIKCFLGHEAPLESLGYLYPDASYQTMISNCLPGYDFIFFGHSHQKLMFAYEGKVLANFGSVGQSRACGGLAEWGYLDTENFVVRQMANHYDVTELSNLLIDDQSVPERLNNILYRRY